jgi:hypothetical protein
MEKLNTAPPGRTGARGRHSRTRHVGRGLAAAAMLAALVLPAQASAAPTPALAKVSTGAAQQVSFGSAVLTGSVNPNGSDTSYYFQYGPTAAYGGQTAIADAGAGTHALSVSLPVTGLQPITKYHYRLIAVNAAGAATGKDKTLLTSKVPLTLQILTSPNPVLFGGTITVQGTLSGTGNGNREVVLQAQQFPFTSGFQNVAENPELTTATGSFSFPVLGLQTVTQFRVATSTTPSVISPVSVENVAVQVGAHVGRARRRHFARIYGTVTPAENGMRVRILRISHGRGVLVGSTIVRHRSASSSTFSRVVPVRAGAYRVLVSVTSGAQVSNYSRPLLIR